jgi:uncharacterized protein YbcI
MEMEPAPTAGQVERDLSQRTQALYFELFGKRPGQVTCQLFSDKVAIVIEDSITKPEQLLAQEGQQELAEQVRSELDATLRSQLKALIEEILGVPVQDLLTDATLETGRTGILVVLAATPTVRDPASIPKTKRKSL